MLAILVLVSYKPVSYKYKFLCPFLHTALSQRKYKENFQNRSYHMIIDERSKKTGLDLTFAKETIGFYFRQQS